MNKSNKNLFPIPKRSLSRNIVTLLFAFGIVPLAIVSLFFFYSYFEGQKRAIEDLEKEVAKRLATSISSHLERTMDQIELFARLEDFEKLTKQELEYRLYDFLYQWHEYAAITIADHQGREISKVSRYYTFSPAELGKLPRNAAFQQALMGKTHISQIKISPDSQLPHVRISAAVRDFQDFIHGVIVVDVNISKMWRLLSRYQIGEQRDAYIVDSKGTLIVHESLASVLKRKNLQNIEGVKALLAGRIGAFAYEGLSNKPVIGANAVVAPTGWGLLVEEPMSAAYRGLYILSAILLGLFVIIIASAILFGLRFSSKRIVSPVKALQEEAAVIARGDFSHRIDMQRHDELGRLCESFNRMVDHLQETTVSRDRLVQEIEERKRTGKALRQSEEKTRALLDAVTETVMLLDIEGTILAVNKVATDRLEQAESELPGKSVFDLFPPDLARSRKATFDKVIATRQAVRIEDEREGKSFDTHWYPILDEKGAAKQVAVFAIDITERRLLEEERLQVAKLESTGRFAGGIAHDFNNLLTGILGYIDLAQALEEPGADLHQYLEKSKKSCLRATELTQQFITFARGGKPVKKIGSIEKTITDSTKLALAGSDVSYEFAIPQDLWLVEFDEGQLSQIITILVTNAIEAMPEGGNITISAANISIAPGRIFQNTVMEDGEYVRVSLQDRGIGIPEEHLLKIFDPYFSTKQRGVQKGMGLGLSTAYSITKQHEGYIFIESKVGSGTTAHVYLSRATGPDREEAGRPVLVEGQESFVRKQKILVMDDEEMIRNITCEMLSKMGYEVQSAAEGREAVQLYERAAAEGEAYDAVLLDLTVRGGMGGRQTIKKLKALDPEVQGIAMSGYTDDPIMTDFRKYGFQAALTKPFDIQALKATLQKCLGKGDS